MAVAAAVAAELLCAPVDVVPANDEDDGKGAAAALVLVLAVAFADEDACCLEVGCTEVVLVLGLLPAALNVEAPLCVLVRCPCCSCPLVSLSAVLVSLVFVSPLSLSPLRCGP